MSKSKQREWFRILYSTKDCIFFREIRGRHICMRTVFEGSGEAPYYANCEGKCEHFYPVQET